MNTLGCAVLFLCASVLAVQQPPLFRTANHTIAVYATVRDASGHLVPHLTKDDFSVSDDGQRTDIVVFSNEPVPITVALMLDMSESMGPNYLEVRAAARAFIDALWEGDRATIGTFGAEVAVSPHLTSDKVILRRVAEEEIWPGGRTPMWNGLRAGMMALSGQPGRRVVVALTDGQEACPAFMYDRVPYPPGLLSEIDFRKSLNTELAGTLCVSAPDVARQAAMQGVMVYGVQFRGTGSAPDSIAHFQALIDESGGGRFALETNADLATTFARVVEELHHQYTIGFVPHALDGKAHHVTLRLKDPTLRVRTRNTYVAPLNS